MSDATDDLWNEAMALLLRWQTAPDDAEVREAIRRFCAESDAHFAAWESAKRLYRLTGEATGAPAREAARRRKRELTRRSVLGGIGAFAVGTATLKGPDLWQWWQADLQSATGAISQHALADGTKLVLGPDSAVRLTFSPARRRVDLLDGMALFDVAHDPARPFEVSSGTFVARTRAAASFEISRNQHRSLVGVSSGRIMVERTGRDKLGELADGDWIAGEGIDVPPRRGRRDAAAMAAWRNRQLIADEERIDAVVTEIARWQSARVVIADWNLGSSRVSGLYDLSDPHMALQAVVSPYGGRVWRMTPWLTVLSSV